MATDPQFDSALERIVTTLRGELEAALQRQSASAAEKAAAEREAAVRQVAEKAAAEREAAVRQAAEKAAAERETAVRQAAEKAAAERETAVRQAADAIRKETQDQLARLQQAAETQIAGFRRELEQVRHSTQEQIDAAKRGVQAEAAARVRAEAQVEDVRRIGRTQVEEAQRIMNDKLSAMTRELDESRREASVRRQELDSARGESAASLTELVRGLHAVDEAESLTAVFERLIDAARHHSNGAAVLLVRPDGLREAASAGFEGRAAKASERANAIASNAASERRRVESESAIAFPVSVGGEVVAVLYAEVADALSPQRRMSKDALDALTRHAGRVLETITVQQAAGLRPVRQGLHTRADRSMGERLS